MRLRRLEVSDCLGFFGSGSWVRWRLSFLVGDTVFWIGILDLVGHVRGLLVASSSSLGVEH